MRLTLSIPLPHEVAFGGPAETDLLGREVQRELCVVSTYDARFAIERLRPLLSVRSLVRKKFAGLVWFSASGQASLHAFIATTGTWHGLRIV